MSNIMLSEDDDMEGGGFPLVPILFIPVRMLTRDRLAPLLTLTSHVSLQVFIADDDGEVRIRVAVPSEEFERASDSALVEIVKLFRGIVGEESYHPRLLSLLRRSLN